MPPYLFIVLFREFKVASVCLLISRKGVLHAMQAMESVSSGKPKKNFMPDRPFHTERGDNLFSGHSIRLLLSCTKVFFVLEEVASAAQKKEAFM